MPIQINAAFEWPNDDRAFVVSLAMDLKALGARVEGRTRPQQSSTTMHEIKVRSSPAIAGGILELFAGVAEAGALVTLEMHSEESD